MLLSLVSGTALAASLLAPPIASPVAAPAGATTGEPTYAAAADTILIPLVREELGQLYTLSVSQDCPADFPYVHTDEWVGSLPSWVSFSASPGPSKGQRGTVLVGSMTNWNPVEKRYVSIDLACTSNPNKAVIVGTTP